MAKKVIITGVSGFAGSHLAEYLADNDDYQLSGTYLSEKSLANVQKIQQKLKLARIDLTQKDEVLKLVEEIKPDLIFHLAALPAVGDSFSKPSEVIVNNVVAQINLLEAIRHNNLLDSKILVVSSADVYGRVPPEDLPIDEETKFYPTNAYAVSKIAQDYSAFQYYIAYGMNVVRTRPFNHFGPRQQTGFVVADWAKKIAQIEKKQTDPVLLVGNLNVTRDFTDVRDIVRAYVMLMEKGLNGEVYNIGSDTAHKIEDILNKLLVLSDAKITVSVDKTLMRPEDSPNRVCDSRKFRSLTGWKPEISLEQTLKDTLDYWRNII